MDPVLFRKRCRLLCIAAAAWLLAALAFHLTAAGPRREHFLQLGREIALSRSEYHLPRGRLLAADGTPLAWSEKYFDLHWQSERPLPARLEAELQALFGAEMLRDRAPDGSRVLRRDLSPPQLENLEKSVSRHQFLAIRSRLERVSVNLPRLRPLLGEVALENGRQVGISGWEKEYDLELAGKPGSYEVMLDRYRNWIESTWKPLVEAEAGRDVRLNLNISGE